MRIIRDTAAKEQCVVQNWLLGLREELHGESPCTLVVHLPSKPQQPHCNKAAMSARRIHFRRLFPVRFLLQFGGGPYIIRQQSFGVSSTASLSLTHSASTRLGALPAA